jgi:outer membrane protein assembly factor BamA
MPSTLLSTLVALLVAAPANEQPALVDAVAGSVAHQATDQTEPASETGPLPDTSRGISAPPGRARGWEVEPGPEGEDTVLFLPRLVLAVPRVALACLFWPLRKGVELVERYRVVENVEDLLYNDERTAGVLPTASYQSGFGITAGANAFHNSLFGHDEKLSFGARYGGRFSQAYKLHFRGDHVAGTRLWLDVRARYEREPVERFFGIGQHDEGERQGSGLDPYAGAAVETAYRQERTLGVVGVGYTIGNPGSQIKTGATLIFNDRTLGPEAGTRGDRTSIEEVFDTSLVPGFDTGVPTVEIDGLLVADFRDGEGLTAAGATLELFAGGVPGPDDWRYWHYGVELTHTIDLYAHTRLLSLRVAIEAVEGDRDEIPFTNLPRLGGPDTLRGWAQDRFRGRRAALASVEYRYPIHQRLLGVLYVDSGRVSSTHADLFRSSAWNVGGGGGLLFGSADSVQLRLDVGYGDDLHFFISGDIAHAFDNREKQL